MIRTRGVKLHNWLVVFTNPEISRATYRVHAQPLIYPRKVTGTITGTEHLRLVLFNLTQVVDVNLTQVVYVNLTQVAWNLMQVD